MATDIAPTPVAPPEPKQKAVIKRTTDARESAGARLLKKQLPALVVSGAVHVALVAAMISMDMLIAKPPEEAPSEALVTVVAPEEKPPEETILTNTDVGLDATIPAAVEAENLAKVNVMDVVQAQEDPGALNAAVAPMKDIIPPAGLGDLADTAGVAGDMGAFISGGGGVGSGDAASESFQGRGAGTRSKMVAEGGGSDASEAAVARGVLWLTKQQRKDGSWKYDGTSDEDTCSATALALLPFLAAGQTHTGTGPDNKYKANVAAGLTYLTSCQLPSGAFRNVTKGRYYMYSHALATITLCEALGMTGDPKLIRPAQLAINFIATAQAGNGSWGYKPNEAGDTSIVGWQVQALKAAKECKQLRVSNLALEKASKFLDSVSSGPQGSRYGYRDAGSARPALTAVGLLTRHYASGWQATNPGMAAGVAYLLKDNPPTKSNLDIYYYYYATQVVHFFEGPEWATWNEKMRDLLIATQDKSNKPELLGSWPADKKITGEHVGRLGTTCLSLLTLEVYYRHLSLNKRGTGGLKELERGL